jgi:hypothetical protein
MNDIYAQKAKKYKYKYLKLKKELEGGNYLGEGAYGCIISPPHQFIFNDNKQIICHKDNNIYDKNYVGKLLRCNDIIGKEYINSFYEEYCEFIKLDNIDSESKHRSKLVFAAYINDAQYKHINEEYKQKDNRIIFIDCLNKKINRQIQTIDIVNISDKEKGKSYKFGYIISTKVGKSFDKVKLNEFDKNQIIQILTNLKESIKDLITTLYTKNLIHADIKFPNMTLDIENNFKVCFIDFGLMKNYKDNKDMEKLKNISQYYLYPDILYTYFHIIRRMHESSMITKLELIQLLNLYENLKQQFNHYNPSLLNITKLQKINYSHFFKSLEDNVKYPLKYIFSKCIEPIIKNIDMYALSLFIYELFFNNNSNNRNPNIFDPQYRKNNAIGPIIQMLLINAIYNNIDGPEELIIYLDGIINNLNGTYKKGDIKKEINKRRTNINKPYINYYYDGYSEELSEGEDPIIPYTQRYQPQPQLQLQLQAQARIQAQIQPQPQPQARIQAPYNYQYQYQYQHESAPYNYQYQYQHESAPVNYQ